MIHYTEALDIIAQAVKPLAASDCPLDQLDNQATAEDVISKIDVPGFANSAMDGFAVRSADTSTASDSDPVRLPVHGVMAAGDRPGQELGAGTAVEIMTGAPIPTGADAVIPVEQVETKPADQDTIPQIIIGQPVAAGHNIRLPGEDFRRGDTLLRKGRLISPHGIMGIAATGIDRVRARPAPRIAVLTTGSELTASGVPNRAGIIRDANGPYLRACVQRLGATLTRHESISDSPEALEKTIGDTQDKADIVLTTGGVSAGRFDSVPDAVVRLGGEVLFHKVAIRPGKPLLFARLADGNLLFGLPGNPIAVAACLRFFVMPALRLLQDLPAERFHAARAMENIRKKPGMRFFGKAQVEVNDDGQLQTRLLPGQESFKINPLVKSNGWAIIPEDVETVAAGDLIEVAPLYPTEFLQ
jgi:molybdopterin molybdotransferase